MKALKIVPPYTSLDVTDRETGETVKKTNPYLFDNSTLSVIIRFHQRDRLNFLEEALFSLALQSWSDVEPIIVLQNGTDDLKHVIIDMIDHQPWRVPPKHKIVTVSIPEGIDGRSVLLNRGIEQATGRYLSFLDDDDCVYQHGYTTLIRQLIEGDRALAVGGCRRAQMGYENKHWFIYKKDNFFGWGRTRIDLFTENFVPIHSYVIDRARIGDFDLQFDESFTLLEDYEFLLRLCAAHEPDFTRLETPVCEYRIRLDGSNSIAHTSAASSEVVALQRSSQLMIQERKNNLSSKYFIDENLSEFMKPPASPAHLEFGGRAQKNDSDEERRVLLQIVMLMYDFFSHHQQLERRLSKTLHFIWAMYKKPIGNVFFKKQS